MQKKLWTLQIVDEINTKREKLNKRVIGGIDSEVVALSQELDELITVYARHQLAILKN